VDSLLAPHGASVEWFRHPFLHAGDTAEKKRGLSQFLEARGWRVAPVTVDNQEWVYAYVYHVALRQADTALAERVSEAFLDHLDEAFAYFERRSREVLGREVDQVLLLHANRLVANHIDEVLALMRARGYTFIPLVEAMEDPAYERGDPWLGKGGPSWIERWAVAAGGEARRGPREDAWVAEEYRRLRAQARTGLERVGPGVIFSGGEATRHYRGHRYLLGSQVPLTPVDPVAPADGGDERAAAISSRTRSCGSTLNRALNAARAAGNGVLPSPHAAWPRTRGSSLSSASIKTPTGSCGGSSVEPSQFPRATATFRRNPV
jgi:hypothetical protein